MLIFTRRNVRLAALALVAATAMLTASGNLFADDKPQPDVIIFPNGDQLTGQLVRVVGGTVTFHNDIVGDINVTWDKIKELRTAQKMVIIENGVRIQRHHIPADMPVGTFTVTNQQIELQSASNGATIPPIPVKNTQFIVDEATVNKQLRGEPGFFQAWNGSATAGLTLVQATQNQYTFSAALALARVVPTVSWLDPRNRTTVDYSQSYGKITEPSYIDPTGAFIPSTYTKSSLFHADAERDEYVSPRLYLLGNVAFDHNYSQSLDLQQMYGGGIGYTVIKTPKQELDIKATVQYEKQVFFDTLTDQNQNLIASTFGGTYTRQLPGKILYTQQAVFIPAWNNTHAYSAMESNTLGFPVYKNFGFTLGTTDSYLNNVPVTFPPTKRNSFQLTAGITYNIKSSY